jgi:hypothetical protein
MLWSGTAASVIDLHPAGFKYSFGRSLSSSAQVGFAQTSANINHAMLWTGTAASAVDLHPAGFTNSIAAAVHGSLQFGHAWGPNSTDPTHAILWNGTAASAIDLNPVGFIKTSASGISLAGQVGSGSGPATAGEDHALFWTGTAASAVDLHSLVTNLNPGFVRSYAVGIADNGTIVGQAQTADGTRYAIIWTQVPEPATLAYATLALAAGCHIRSRRR